MILNRREGGMGRGRNRMMRRRVGLVRRYRRISGRERRELRGRGWIRVESSERIIRMKCEY